ncbi:MAG: HlyD family type I secretion periplasmic adaptor subunit [Pseudomonadota bacterium]
MRQPALAGALVIGVGLGGFSLWAAAAPLAGAAIAPGVISPDGSRRTVQHLEGGIIRQLLVKDGSTVRVGDPLLVLEDVRVRAGHDVLRTRFHTLAAAQARLLAEQAGEEEIRFPAWLVATTAEDAAALQTIVAQRQLFRTRAEGLAQRRGILTRRIAQLNDEIAGLEAQIAADDRQLALIAEEIEGLELLFNKGLAPKTRLLALKRAQSDIEGDRAERQSRIARTGQAIGETELQIIAQGTALRDEANEELSRTQAELAEIEERLTASRDVLSRTLIKAPSAGTVVEMRFHTPGGVIRPGEPIMDIVPRDEELLVDARLSPLDIDIVAPGLPAQILLPAFTQRHMPRIEGTVRSISADVIVDPQSGERYFEARIEVDQGQLAALEPSVELTAGMPAEVFIMTTERTVLDYLLQPLFASLGRAFRES